MMIEYYTSWFIIIRFVIFSIRNWQKRLILQAAHIMYPHRIYEYTNITFTVIICLGCNKCVIIMQKWNESIIKYYNLVLCKYYFDIYSCLCIIVYILNTVYLSNVLKKKKFNEINMLKTLTLHYLKQTNTFEWQHK